MLRKQSIGLHLDTRNRLIAREVMSVDHPTAAPVHPREASKAAILAGAASMAFVRDHPSGDPEPSCQDIDLSRAGS